MAGDWIKMRLDLSEDPAVIAMAAELGLTECHVVGLLHKAWGWADKQSQNGHAKGVTLSWLDRYIGVTGFGKALENVGWLVVEDGLKFPNFDRHNGDSAKKRASATERKRAERERHAEVTTTSHVKRDKSVTREEKRREEVIPPNPQPSGFENFWLAWPASDRKAAKGKCSDLWKRKGFEQSAAQIVAHVEAMKVSQDWRKNGGEFIPAPLSYLNQARWEGASLNGHDNPTLKALREEYGKDVRPHGDGFTDGVREWTKTGERRAMV